MVNEVDRLNRAITQLLDFSRPTDIKRRSTDLTPLISHSLQLIQQDAANHKVRIDVTIQEDICPVLVDPDRLSQCLLNLYLNAIQAMENGGTLTVACGTVDARFVRISIGDTGKGIESNHIDKIFDPYFSTKNKGTGLGLAIVHKIIEAHYARIYVESAIGKGATFVLQIPLSFDSNEREKSMNAPRPTRILIVDDDQGHLTTLKTIVRSWGYVVETAEDGTQAVQWVKSEPVDLVLMDVRMARMSGIEALERIKAYNPSIPVIIMTAYSSVDSAVDALKAGAYDYLIKPLDFEVLKLTIERARDHAGLKAENKRLRKQLRVDEEINPIIGKSRAMEELMEMLAMVAPSDATVLVTGESGTGKELIARSFALFQFSKRWAIGDR